MTVDAPTDRPPFNAARSVTVNAWFMLATVVLAIAAMVAEFCLAASPWHPLGAFNEQAMAERLQFAITASTIIAGLVMAGLCGSFVTLIWLLVDRLAAKRTGGAPARVQVLSAILLVAAFVLTMLSLFFLAFLMPRLLEMFKDFDIQLPGMTMCYIGFSNFVTNPFNALFAHLPLAVVAVLLVVKEFFIKDKVAAYLLNALITFGLLVWTAFGCISALLPFMAVASVSR